MTTRTEQCRNPILGHELSTAASNARKGIQERSLREAKELRIHSASEGKYWCEMTIPAWAAQAHLDHCQALGVNAKVQGSAGFGNLTISFDWNV